MKWIKYRLLSRVNTGTGETPLWEDLLQEYGLQYSEENEALVKGIAYQGEYTVEEDAQGEAETEPTQDERIAQLEEALALLLSGVTE